MKISKRKESNPIIWIIQTEVHCSLQKALFERKNSCILPNIINRNIDQKRRKEGRNEGRKGGRAGGRERKRERKRKGKERNKPLGSYKIYHYFSTDQRV